MTLARVRMSVRMRADPRQRAFRPPQGRWVKWLILRSTTGRFSRSLLPGRVFLAGFGVLQGGFMGWMVMTRPARAFVQSARSGQD
jgi:hypothetical protein